MPLPIGLDAGWDVDGFEGPIDDSLAGVGRERLVGVRAVLDVHQALADLDPRGLPPILLLISRSGRVVPGRGSRELIQMAFLRRGLGRTGGNGPSVESRASSGPK